MYLCINVICGKVRLCIYVLIGVGEGAIVYLCINGSCGKVLLCIYVLIGVGGRCYCVFMY